MTDTSMLILFPGFPFSPQPIMDEPETMGVRHVLQPLLPKSLHLHASSLHLSLSSHVPFALQIPLIYYFILLFTSFQTTILDKYFYYFISFSSPRHFSRNAVLQTHLFNFSWVLPSMLDASHFPQSSSTQFLWNCFPTAADRLHLHGLRPGCSHLPQCLFGILGHPSFQ